VILWNFDLNDLLVRGCAWLNDYLKNPNANIKPEENRYIVINLDPHLLKPNIIIFKFC
jgi:hypothetical protein